MVAKKRKPKPPTAPRTALPTRRPGWLTPTEAVVAAALVGFAATLALFPIRNLDIWWHLAVGRYIVTAREFITSDPFTYTVTGIPWVPHSWLADIVLYVLQRSGGFEALIAIRLLLVCGTVALILAVAHRLRVSMFFVAPVLVTALLTAHSRFIIRPHLLEYLFIFVLLLHLLSRREQRGWGFFVVPVALQVVWVNVHTSFYVGLVVVALFYVGEWLTRLLGTSDGLLRGTPVRWKSVGILLAAMTIASCINPSPREFLLQPLDLDRGRFLTQFILEWRSPFDPALARTSLHPYYEWMLVFTVGAVLLAWKRLRFASLLLVGFFLALSLRAHRFRVEFVFLAVPLMLDQLQYSPLIEQAKRKLRSRAAVARYAPHVVAVALAVAISLSDRERFIVGPVLSDDVPIEAMEFVREHDIAKRPFHSFGHGSYLIWALFPERRAFIDGRAIDPVLYRDFLACQSTRAGFDYVIDKYDVDGFILPGAEHLDPGVRNLHGILRAVPGWTLVYIDGPSQIYVRDDVTPEAWRAPRAYRFYNPVTFQQLKFVPAQVDSVRNEIERALAESDGHRQPLLDLARFEYTVGNIEAAKSNLDRLLAMDPKNPGGLDLQRRLRSAR